MSQKANPKQLVLRRDTATGMTLVGWEEDLPAGRFEHLELIYETEQNCLPDHRSEDFTVYEAALHRARQANRLVLEQQQKQLESKGWYPVPFELATKPEMMKADKLGSYSAAAMQLFYQLTRNAKQVWAVLYEGEIVHVRARYPKKQLDELTYQVWYHKQLHELNEIDGSLLEGELMISESGLWFVANRDHHE